jgi:hypothetical protein
MLAWAHERGVKLFLIEPGKPNQNAYIESFNGRFREECLNEHWFTSLQHAKVHAPTVCHLVGLGFKLCFADCHIVQLHQEYLSGGIKIALGASMGKLCPL